MTLTVVGSIAFDAVETPSGSRDRLLGGSAVHFSIASSQFSPTRIVGPVGDDFGEEQYAILHSRGVITDDVEHVPGGKTFFWAGRYHRDINQRDTIQTDLNVFEDFRPKLSDASRGAEVLFLGNIQPDLQREVHAQCPDARLVGLDTMNLWIETTRDSLIETISGVDFVLVNDEELRELTEQPNLVRAARTVMEWGPRTVVAKQGEYGAALFTGDEFFSLPSYPLETVRDPTGAGDTFAGGFLGYLAAQGADSYFDEVALRRAMTYGSVLASFNVEEFGTERVQRLSREEIDERYEEFRRITSIEEVPS